MNGSYVRAKENRYFSDFKELFPDSAYLFMSNASYLPVGESYEAVWKSLDKMDKGIVLDRSCPFHRLAVVYTDKILGPILESVPSFNWDFVMDTSPGALYKKYGYKFKTEAIESEIFDVMYNNDFVPIWSVAGKEEFQSKVDIKDSKIRTFIIPPVDFLVKQKILYTNQNLRLSEHNTDTWSRYGMTPQYGGFHSLMSAMEKFNLRWSGDISGYDRGLQVLPEVYQIRNKRLHVPPQMVSMVDYVTEHSVYSTLLFPDGYLYRRLCGNNSGSFNTTTDNTIGHHIMKMRFLIKLWYESHGEMPTIKDIMLHTVVNVMSDDNCGSLDDVEFKVDLKSFEAALRANYAFYGLELKENALYLQYSSGPMDGMEFLGMTAKTIENLYYPMPRIGKICSRIVYSDKKSAYWQELAKATALLIQAAPVPEFAGAFREYLKYLLSRDERAHCLHERPEILWDAYDAIDNSQRTMFLYQGIEVPSF